MQLFNMPVMAGFAAWVVLLIYGLQLTFLVSPHSTGVAIMSVVFVGIVTYSTDLRSRSAVTIGRCM